MSEFKKNYLLGTRAKLISDYNVYAIGDFRNRNNANAIITLDRGDHIVGTMSNLRHFRNCVRQQGGEAKAEIHHIVENCHLQFLDFNRRLNEHSYLHLEPCVLLSEPRHELFLAGIRMAEKFAAPFIVKERQDRCKLESRLVRELNRTEARDHRLEWCVKNDITVDEIRDVLNKLYSDVYSWSEWAPIEEIAHNVIQDFPG